MDYSYENNLLQKGYQSVCGLDEAGRGPLAGPIVAGAVILDPNQNDFFGLLNDSKKLTEKKRDEAFAQIIKKSRCWSIGVVRHYEIDIHGLAYANKIAMKRAWQHLKIKPDYILCDYVAKIAFETSSEIIIGGDAKVISISAASILAKVFRDKMMTAFDAYFPEYGFAKHKGYGTKQHMQSLEQFGPCEIHRKSFAPVRSRMR